jgi:hypothetical protein
MSEDLIKYNILKKNDFLKLNSNSMKLISNMGNKLNELENKNMRNYLSFVSTLDFLKDLVLNDTKFLLKVLKLYYISEDRTKANIIATFMNLFQYNNVIAKKFIKENQNEFDEFYQEVLKERKLNNHPDLKSNSISFVMLFFQLYS